MSYKISPPEIMGRGMKDRIMVSDIKRYDSIYKTGFFDYDNDHVFCPIECCEAFIQNSKEKLHDNSLSLLFHLKHGTSYCVNEVKKIFWVWNFKQNSKQIQLV